MIGFCIVQFRSVLWKSEDFDSWVDYPEKRSTYKFNDGLLLIQTKEDKLIIFFQYLLGSFIQAAWTRSRGEPAKKPNRKSWKMESSCLNKISWSIVLLNFYIWFNCTSTLNAIQNCQLKMLIWIFWEYSYKKCEYFKIQLMHYILWMHQRSHATQSNKLISTCFPNIFAFHQLFV